MARTVVRTVSSRVCTEGFGYVVSAVCGQRLSALAGVQHVVDIAVCHQYYVPPMHILLSARRNYKKTRQLSHLTSEEQFILRVGGVLSLHVFHIISDVLLYFCSSREVTSTRFVVTLVGYSSFESQNTSGTSMSAMLHAISAILNVSAGHIKCPYR